MTVDEGREIFFEEEEEVLTLSLDVVELGVEVEWEPWAGLSHG